MRRTAAADILLPAITGGDDPDLFYDLASYESLAGRHDAAVSHLRRCTEITPTLRELAVGDVDFDPIRAALTDL